ncbi:Aste57867_25215 [Aphanomyces stellatus]|uniref:Aste57867_25215 protein n=1 Tax=Aphanomyces stellatus TaxID=120398 RepID=A0A485LTW9_9STRA|nr:hypothetical protein As57867_025137 [Aphanomyces stellatus]VFU01842.1 Aste57867_25215 [Aphanomyces stellatus]
MLTFGCNDDGQLGRGEKKKPSNTSIDGVSSSHQPQQVDALRGLDVVMISCGSRHTLALTADGEVFSWGWGQMGQLGHENHKNLNLPTKIQFFADHKIKVAFISAGGCHSGAITDKGQVYMWGEAHWGQLGLSADFKELHQATPVLCKVLPANSTDKIISLSCGGTHTVALSGTSIKPYISMISPTCVPEQGHVYTWGRRDNGQLGLGRKWLHLEIETDGASSFTPTRIDPAQFGNEKVVQVSAGAFHTAAVTETGAVFTWGKEDYGMLGVGHTADIHKPRKVTLFDSEPAIRVSCGGWHTAVVTRSGDAYVFGRGEYGRLGLGDTRCHATPIKVSALSDHTIVEVACGGTHSLFLTAKGQAFSCGRADHGRLGNEEVKKFCVVPEGIQETNLGSVPVIQVSTGGAHSSCLLHSSRPVASSQSLLA